MLDNKKGLTLIELLGVIVIIGIIATIAFFSITRIIEGTQKDAFIANVNNFIEAAKLDAETRWLQNPSQKTFTYQITKDENEKVVINLLELGEKGNDVNLGFDRDLGIKNGKVTITYTEEGGIEVKIIEPFDNGSFRTKADLNNQPLNLPLNRDQVEKVPDPSEEGQD